MKTCALCGEEKPLGDYYRDRRMKDGRMWRCKVCIRAKQATYKRDAEKTRERWRRANNTDAGRARAQRWLETNRERYLEQKKRRNERDRDKRAIAWAAYYEKNRDELRERYRAKYDAEKKRITRKPEQTRLDRERRRARLLAAYVEDAPFDDILQRDLGRCGICDEPIMENTIELDHIIPLAAGGRHERSNVQLAHRSCNRRKWIRIDDRMAA